MTGRYPLNAPRIPKDPQGNKALITYEQAWKSLNNHHNKAETTWEGLALGRVAFHLTTGWGGMGDTGDCNLQKRGPTKKQ